MEVDRQDDARISKIATDNSNLHWGVAGNSTEDSFSRTIRRKLSPSRFFGILSRSSPLSIFVVSFLAGQTLAEIWGYRYWLALLLGACLVRFWRGGILPAAGFGLLLGGAMMALVEMSPAVVVPGVDTYLVRIAEVPRRPTPGRINIFARLEARFDGKYQRLPGTLVNCRGRELPWRNIAGIEPGDLVVIRGSFSQLKKPRELFSRDAQLYRHGVRASCKIKFISAALEKRKSIFSEISNRIRENTEKILGEGERSGIVLSMAIGVRDVLSEATEEVYRQTGLAHLLVVSGYQVGLLYWMIEATLLVLFGGFLRATASDLLVHLPTIIAVLGAGVFVGVCGAEPPAMRALVAVVLLASTKMTYGRSGAWHGFLLCLLSVALIWPGALLEPSAQLTFAALAGLMLGEGAKSKSFIDGFLEAIRAMTLASLCTAAVAIWWFGRVSLSGFLLNPLLAPLLSILSCAVGIPLLALAYFNLPFLEGPLSCLAWFLQLVTAFLEGLVTQQQEKPNIESALFLVYLWGWTFLLIAPVMGVLIYRLYGVFCAAGYVFRIARHNESEIRETERMGLKD